MPSKPNKRKVERAEIISISEDGLVQLVEDTMTRILQGFVAPTPGAGAGEDVQRLRVEVEANTTKVRIELTQLVNTMMERMQAEAERRAETMLQRLTRMLKTAPKIDNSKAALLSEAEPTSGRSTQMPNSQRQIQPTRAEYVTLWSSLTRQDTATKKTHLLRSSHGLDNQHVGLGLAGPRNRL